MKSNVRSYVRTIVRTNDSSSLHRESDALGDQTLHLGERVRRTLEGRGEGTTNAVTGRMPTRGARTANERTFVRTLGAENAECAEGRVSPTRPRDLED